MAVTSYVRPDGAIVETDPNWTPGGYVVPASERGAPVAGINLAPVPNRVPAATLQAAAGRDVPMVRQGGSVIPAPPIYNNGRPTNVAWSIDPVNGSVSPLVGAYSAYPHVVYAPEYRNAASELDVLMRAVQNNPYAQQAMTLMRAASGAGGIGGTGRSSGTGQRRKAAPVANEPADFVKRGMEGPIGNLERPGVSDVAVTRAMEQAGLGLSSISEDERDREFELLRQRVAENPALLNDPQFREAYAQYAQGNVLAGDTFYRPHTLFDASKVMEGLDNPVSGDSIVLSIPGSNDIDTGGMSWEERMRRAASGERPVMQQVSPSEVLPYDYSDMPWMYYPNGGVNGPVIPPAAAAQELARESMPGWLKELYILRNMFRTREK